MSGDQTVLSSGECLRGGGSPGEKNWDVDSHWNRWMTSKKRGKESPVETKRGGLLNIHTHISNDSFSSALSTRPTRLLRSQLVQGLLARIQYYLTPAIASTSITPDFRRSPSRSSQILLTIIICRPWNSSGLVSHQKVDVIQKSDETV